MTPRKIHLIGLVMAATALLGGCAGGGGARPGPNPALTGVSDRAGDMLLKRARDMKSAGDCASALPLYRQLGAFGRGFELAQAELAECALTLAGAASSADSDLLRLEARLWLERAAYAGEPSAQKRLALAYGPGGGLDGEPVRALAWAYIYNANGQRDALSLPPLIPFEINKIRNEMSAEQLAEARALADRFALVLMPIYEPPKRQQAARSDGPNRAAEYRRRRR